MSKASIHIKPCNIAQSEAHNRRDKEYLKSLNPDMIYIDTFLTPFNKSYVTPEQEFTSLQEYYEELKAMVKEKTEALESEIKGLDFDEEELSVPEIETDSIVKKAKEAIRKELSIPVPVVGREKWREEREEAVKAIMTHMEDNLIAAKGSQKRKILSYGKALYKQTKREIYKTSEENKQWMRMLSGNCERNSLRQTSAPKTPTLRLPRKRKRPIGNGAGPSKSAIGQTTLKRRSARYSLSPRSNSFGR